MIYLINTKKHELLNSEFKDISIKKMHAIAVIIVYEHKISSLLASELVIIVVLLRLCLTS